MNRPAPRTPDPQHLFLPNLVLPTCVLPMLLAASCLGARSLADDAAVAGVYHAARPGSLAEAKRRLSGGDPELRAALGRLVDRADAWLAVEPPSVTAKKLPAASGDRHDYASLAPYYWPDDHKADGLPYVRRDGLRNPESQDERLSDRRRISMLSAAVETLGLAWHFTRDDRYAAHAAAFARTWFVDESTRMTPHLQFAQAVRGSNRGRGSGIIEGREIAEAIDALALIADSRALSPKERRTIDAWADSYLDWLLDSDHGRRERAAANNHGTYFDVQVVQLALATGRRDLAADVLGEAGRRRIAAQIEPDGSQPHELARTKSLGYSGFNLRGLCQLATLGEHAGIDLWHDETPDGRSIRRAIDFLVPYVASPPAPWPYEQIAAVPPDDFASVLWRAAIVYDAPGYATLVKGFPDDDDRIRLTFVKE